MKLSWLVSTIQELSDLSPELDETLCLNQRHQHAGQCDACARVCPCDAIVLDPTPQINVDACRGCDACAAVCPAGALVGWRSPLATWRRAYHRAKEGTAALACKVLGKNPITPIPCVSALPPEFYIALAAGGIQSLLLYTGDCAACPMGASLAQAKRAINQAGSLLAALDLCLSIRQHTGPPPEGAQENHAGLSRRGFLTALRQRAAEPETTTSPANDTLDIWLAKGITWQRALLLDGLARVTLPAGAALEAQPHQWAMLMVNDRCVGCEMCALFCPTGALKTSTKDGEVTLWFDAARCTACGLCVRVCFKRALTFADSVPLLALAEGKFEVLWRGRPPSNPLKSSPNQLYPRSS